MALYEDVNRLLTGKTGHQSGHPQSIARANQMIADATKKAQQSGSAITGYRRSNFTFSNKAGKKSLYLDVPIFGGAPTTKIEYQTDPALSKRIKSLEDQLKISQSQSGEYRRQADEVLAAADKRLAQFAINKSAFETQQQQDAAAAAQREAAFQASMKLREDIFAQTNMADMAKRASAFDQQMEKQRAALSGQTAELGRQRTAFETEMLGARQEFAGQQKVFEKSSAEREAAFQKMTIQQQETFRKEQKEAEAAANRSAAVRSANQRRSELAKTIQIQPADGATRRFGGTEAFRRRATQFGTASPYKGLGTIQSGMVNV